MQVWEKPIHEKSRNVHKNQQFHNRNKIFYPFQTVLFVLIDPSFHVQFFFKLLKKNRADPVVHELNKNRKSCIYDYRIVNTSVFISIFDDKRYVPIGPANCGYG